jgi:hypothetical protein
LAIVWHPVDPEDIVDLWMDFAPIVDPDLTIVANTLTAPAGVTLVGTSAVDGLKVRFRQGPSDPGEYLIKGYVTLSNGEARDMEAFLTVRDRVVR